MPVPTAVARAWVNGLDVLTCYIFYIISGADWLFFLCIIFLNIPRHGQRKSLPNALCGRVAQSRGNLADVGQAMAHVTGPEVTVNRLSVLQGRVARQQVGFELGI